MTCPNVPPELEAYADGELDVERDADAIANVTNHLATCAECRAEVARIRQLAAALRRQLPSYPASDMLRARVDALVKPTPLPTPSPTPLPAPSPSPVRGSRVSPRWKVFALAASVLLAIVTTHDVATSNRARINQDAANAELISAHVRSLMLDHLVDVPSSDRHTVKPWFEGKITFAPSVFDFAADSFPLAGGRLDYAHGHPIAAIVFHRGQHAINLFVWPSDSADAGIRSTSQDGFNIASWRRNHLQYSAVSTVNRGALAQFAALYVARDSATDAVQR